MDVGLHRERTVVDSSQLTPQEFRRFQDLIHKLCGVAVPENKVTLLSNRLRRRLRATGIADFDAYFKHLNSPAGREELAGFLSAVTTNETSFFRTEKHFEWLRTEFVDSLARQARAGQRERSLRIWSAACSTGEEPYSIALCLAENQLKLANWKLEILGTDISADVLDKARSGTFSERAMEGVSDKLRSRYFQHDEAQGVWEAKPVLKSMISIQQHNLMQPCPWSDFDCVFIRNVLIYFARESKQVVIEHLVRALRPGGYLVVGPSEGIFDMLGMLTKRSTFLYQKE